MKNSTRSWFNIIDLDVHMLSRIVCFDKNIPGTPEEDLMYLCHYSDTYMHRQMLMHFFRSVWGTVVCHLASDYSTEKHTYKVKRSETGNAMV